MSKVFFDISMSLDGFMTAANQRPEEPMGDGGLKLVEWAFGQDERDRAVLTDGIAGTGAVIAGRRTRRLTAVVGRGWTHRRGSCSCLRALPQHAR